MRTILMTTEHEQAESVPKNKLQRLAFRRGYRTAKMFANAVSGAGIASYGTAFYKWDSRAGNTQYNTLLAIAKFLGARSVEEVFDP